MRRTDLRDLLKHRRGPAVQRIGKVEAQDPGGDDYEYALEHVGPGNRANPADKYVDQNDRIGDEGAGPKGYSAVQATSNT
jgi:hypothetical protein